MLMGRKGTFRFTRLLTDPGAIEDVLAVENDVVPFDRADVPQRPRGTI